MIPVLIDIHLFPDTAHSQEHPSVAADLQSNGRTFRQRVYLEADVL